jgi:hypothetical protein
VRNTDPDPWLTCLAGLKSAGNEITVRQYADMYGKKDRSGIANLMRRRFEERYLEPALDNPNRHGFAMLAVCCLMIEAMESFRNGWKNSEGRSEAAFCGFFQVHDEFAELRPVAHEFYRAVRCGILHQAETTHSWRVDREHGLLTEKGGVRWLSAFEFGTRLKAVLTRYHDELVAAEWGSPLWTNARRKLQAICRNCGLPESEAAKLP